MGGNIVPFVSTHNWKKYSETLRSSMIEGGLSAKRAEEFLDVVKPIFESFQYTYRSSYQVDENIQGATAEIINGEINKFRSFIDAKLGELMNERIAMEMRIFNLSSAMKKFLGPSE